MNTEPIIARFTPAHIAATVHVGNFTDPSDETFLTRVLVERRQIVLRRYFAKLSPLTDVTMTTTAAGTTICATDLARWAGVFEPSVFNYSATVRRGRGADVRPTVETDGRVCVGLPGASERGEAPDDAIERYVVVRIRNGTGSGDLALHLYDLGPSRGARLVGIERAPPS